jgi:hypothetical protein
MKTMLLIAVLVGNLDDSASALADAADVEFSGFVAKLQKELTTKFGEAIEKATQKGDIKQVGRLTEERDSFQNDERALPSDQNMRSARLAFETGWHKAKEKQEAKLAAYVKDFTKKKMFDDAKLLQEAIDEVRKKDFLPLDVANGMTGTWHVKFTGRKKDGSTVDWQDAWEFEKAGSVHSIKGKDNGKWTYDYKGQRVVVNWTFPDPNRPPEWQAFPLPLNPDGIIGHTWDEKAGVRFTASKAK